MPQGYAAILGDFYQVFLSLHFSPFHVRKSPLGACLLSGCQRACLVPYVGTFSHMEFDLELDRFIC